MNYNAIYNLGTILRYKKLVLHKAEIPLLKLNK